MRKNFFPIREAGRRRSFHTSCFYRERGSQRQLQVPKKRPQLRAAAELDQEAKTWGFFRELKKGTPEQGKGKIVLSELCLECWGGSVFGLLIATTQLREGGRGRGETNKRADQSESLRHKGQLRCSEARGGGIRKVAGQGIELD